MLAVNDRVQPERIGASGQSILDTFFRIRNCCKKIDESSLTKGIQNVKDTLHSQLQAASSVSEGKAPLSWFGNTSSRPSVFDAEFLSLLIATAMSAHESR